MFDFAIFDLIGRTTILPMVVTKRNCGSLFSVGLLFVLFQVAVLQTFGQSDTPAAGTQVDGAASETRLVTEIARHPATVDEARERARILHEAFHGALQVMHRDFFREDEKLSLPSRSLEDVFATMAETHQVELHWLAVDANAMSLKHEPKTDFERAAVAALTTGKDEFEQASDDKFQFARSIRLSDSCLKCHARSRSNNNNRKAALTITMPIKNH